MSATSIGRPFAWLLVLLAIAQAAASPVVTAISGGTPGDTGADLLVTPTSFTFAIWGLIYTLSLVHAVVVTQRGIATTRPTELLASLGVVYAGAAIWIVCSAYANSWATFAVLLIMTVAAARAVIVAATTTVRIGVPEWHAALERLTAGIYAGWVMIAVFLNLASALSDADLADPTSTIWQWAIVTAALFAVIALIIAARGAIGVSAAAVWALIGMIVAVIDESALLTVTAIVGIAAVAAATVLMTRRSQARSEVSPTPR